MTSASSSERTWRPPRILPVITEDVVAETRRHYIEVYQRITGVSWVQ
jgi:hypothetical protein